MICTKPEESVDLEKRYYHFFYDFQSLMSGECQYKGIVDIYGGRYGQGGYGGCGTKILKGATLEYFFEENQGGIDDEKVSLHNNRWGV